MINHDLIQSSFIKDQLIEMNKDIKKFENAEKNYLATDCLTLL